MGDTILRVDDIQKFYGNKGNLTKAIDHISFSVLQRRISRHHGCFRLWQNHLAELHFHD